MNDKAKVEALLYKYGYRLKRCRKHQVWENARHDILVISATPSDWRGYQNVLTDLRRQVAGLPISVTQPTLKLTKEQSAGFDKTLGKSEPKPVPIARGAAKGKGTGFIYDDPKVVELTPEQIAEREQRREEKRQRRNAVRAARVQRKEIQQEWVTDLDDAVDRMARIYSNRQSAMQTILAKWEFDVLYQPELRGCAWDAEDTDAIGARRQITWQLREMWAAAERNEVPFTLEVADLSVRHLREILAYEKRTLTADVEKVRKIFPALASLCTKSDLKGAHQLVVHRWHTAQLGQIEYDGYLFRTNQLRTLYGLLAEIIDQMLERSEEVTVTGYDSFAELLEGVAETKAKGAHA